MRRVALVLLAAVLVGCGGDETSTGAREATHAADTETTTLPADSPLLSESCDELSRKLAAADDAVDQFTYELALLESGCVDADEFQAVPTTTTLPVAIPDVDAPLPTDCDELRSAAFAAHRQGKRYQDQYVMDVIGGGWRRQVYGNANSDVVINFGDVAEVATADQYRHLVSAFINTHRAAQRYADRWFDLACYGEPNADGSVVLDHGGSRLLDWAEDDIEQRLINLEAHAAEAGLYCTSRTKSVENC